MEHLTASLHPSVVKNVKKTKRGGGGGGGYEGGLVGPLWWQEASLAC